MSYKALELCIPGSGKAWSHTQIEAVNPCLERLDAAGRVRWALDYLPDNPVLTSSFGAQSAIMLHLVSRQSANIPVVLIDTGYLFPETYRFVDELVERLDLNLKVYRPEVSSAWQEVRHGKLWQEGVDGIRRYNQANKVKPMETALRELQVGTWFSGLRRSQSVSRRRISVLQRHGQTVKVHPLADWSNRDLHAYLKEYELPYHPLWQQGYVSIGDTHSSRPLAAGMEEQDTRFFGLTRECGLHVPERFDSTAA
jgi:phosphoadenosine phosphosulfate reductase